jgi:hypothetical protein
MPLKQNRGFQEPSIYSNEVYEIESSKIYNYRNKELIWVKVNNYDENKKACHGQIDNIPVSKSLKNGDNAVANKDKVVEILK